MFRRREDWIGFPTVFDFNVLQYTTTDNQLEPTYQGITKGQMHCDM